MFKERNPDLEPQDYGEFPSRDYLPEPETSPVACRRIVESPSPSLVKKALELGAKESIVTECLILGLERSIRAYEAAGYVEDVEMLSGHLKTVVKEGIKEYIK